MAECLELPQQQLWVEFWDVLAGMSYLRIVDQHRKQTRSHTAFWKKNPFLSSHEMQYF